MLAAFLLVAGPQALAPGRERFAMCLIAPGVLLLARGAALAWEAASPRWRSVLAAATLLGWLPVADVQTHYFRFIEGTGGQAHATFRTAAVEPKQAALQAILEQSGGRAWIVCSEWWNRWPMRYLALTQRGLCVPEPEVVVASDAYRRALAQGRVWFVEFCGTEALRHVEAQLADQRPSRQTVSRLRPPAGPMRASRRPSVASADPLQSLSANNGGAQQLAPSPEGRG